MNILHIVAGLWKDSGGPSEVIPNLCASLVENGCNVTLATVDGPHSEATKVASRNGVNLISFKEKYFSTIRYTPGLKAFLKSNVGNFDIVHNHGHWLYPNWIGCKYAKKANVPLVTTPHGTLVPGMLAKSSLKKRISWGVFDHDIVRYANKIHALSEAEKIGMEGRLRSANLNKVVVIPNGTYIPDQRSCRSFYETYNVPNNKKILLFLSRVHPIKGIFDLVAVWKELSKQFSDWQLVIVGPSSESDKVKLNGLVADMATISFLGPLYGDDKLSVFSSASAFVLPSYAEGLPTAILEAAANKLPVVCSEECNFPELNLRNGSVVFSAGESSLKIALEKFLELNEFEKREIGENAYKFISQCFSWDRVAKDWIQVYREILG